jgi:pimeloyl-ACP methyl ester carboxylesterase
MKERSTVTSELYYEITGEGQPVVLLRPAFANSPIWDPQWPSSVERFRVVRCDLPRFGRSPIRALPIRYAREVAALLDRLEQSRAQISSARSCSWAPPHRKRSPALQKWRPR